MKTPIEKKEETFEVTPKKDWHLFQPPKHDIYLKEGKKVPVPIHFKPALEAEKVI